jgi:hypothetical protein
MLWVLPEVGGTPWSTSEQAQPINPAGWTPAPAVTPPAFLQNKEVNHL